MINKSKLYHLSILNNIRNPLYKNSLFLISSRIFNIICGFFFWITAAKLYTINDIGFATALISILNLIMLFSRFGFDFSLIRFFPVSDQNDITSTSLIMTTVSSLIIGILFLIVNNFVSLDLSIIHDPYYAIIFLFFIVLNSLNIMTGQTFIAMRKAKFYLTQNLLLSLRIILLIPLIFLGPFGILGSLGLAYLLTSAYAFFPMKKFINLGFKIDRSFIRKSFDFSYKNYISSIFTSVPTLLLPIMILGLLNEAEVAKFNIAFAVGSIVLIIPDAFSTSLFVEGSYGENLKENAIKASIVIYSLLIPTFVILYLFRDFMLGLFGEAYLSASDMLRLLLISSFFISIYSLYIPILNIKMQVSDVVKLNILRCVLLLSLSYILIQKIGITGVGLAWLVTYMFLSLWILASYLKKTSIIKGFFDKKAKAV